MADEAAVRRLQQLLQCDEQQAEFLLEAAGGNENLAVQMALENADMGFGQQEHHLPHAHHPHAPQQQQQPRGAAGPTPPRPRAPAARNAQPAQLPYALAAPLSLIGLVLRVPLMALRFGYGLARSTVVNGAHLALIVGDRVLPQPVMRGVRSAASAAATTLSGGPELDPASQAAGFVTGFKAAYGDRHPRWQEAGWRVAAQQARREFRFLFVYLHSPEHEDTDGFCRGALTHPDVVDYINNNCVAWGGDVTSSDAFVLSQQQHMRVTRFPYVALLSMAQSDNRVALVAAGSGRDVASPGQLLALVSTAVADHGALLAAQRAEIEEREFARRLVEEQDAEYEASLQADRQREAARAEERKRQEEEERQRLAEEQRVREEAEAEAARVAEAAASIDRRRAAARAALLPEAPPGSAASAAIRLRLPDGTNTARGFPEGATLQAVFDFVDSLDATSYAKYHLVANYPRRIFLRAAHGPASLAELGLVPQAALFVQPDE